MNLQSLHAIDKLQILKLYCNGIHTIIPYKKAQLRIVASAQISGEGKLFINRNWKKSNKIVSSLRFDANSELILKGLFDLYYGSDIVLFPKAQLTLGSGYANINFLLRCKEKIVIGKNVRIAHNVTIMDSDFHSFSVNGVSKNITAPVEIQDDVWIGSGALILKGVTIGVGAVVGAGSVVTKNVPAHSLVCGNPAGIVYDNIKWTQ